MKTLRTVYPVVVIAAVGTAILLDRMGVRSLWLAAGFLVLGLVLLVIGLAQSRGAIRAGGTQILSVVAAAGLGAGLVFIGASTFWPSSRLDVVGYALLIVSMILTVWPRRTRGRDIGA